VKNTKEMFTFGAFMTVYKSNFNEFVYHFLNSNVFRFQLGESNTTTVNQLTQKMLRNILIPFPPFADQKRIVEKVDELMSLCDELEKYIVVSK
jgi:type I restriction enzyme S subunit